MLRVVFFGTPHIAADLLEDLLQSRICEVVGVVSRMDKPKGRSKAPAPSPVKELALREGLPLLQAPRCHHPEALSWLRERQADLFLVVAFGEILKSEVLALPPMGCWNVHASLLPKYRGAAPMQWALRNGDLETGISLQRMVLACDAGAVAAESRVSIPQQMNLAELQSALLEAAKPLLHHFLKDLETGRIHLADQDESQVTWAPKIELEDCQIDWTQPAARIHNLIRSCDPEPGAFTWQAAQDETKRFRILKSRVDDHPSSNTSPLLAGQCSLQNSMLLVGTGEGRLELLVVQPESKRPMPAKDFVNGLKGTLPLFVSTKNDSPA
jgi:methionyl-tRNA formyltransferase